VSKRKRNKNLVDQSEKIKNLFRESRERTGILIAMVGAFHSSYIVEYIGKYIIPRHNAPRDFVSMEFMAHLNNTVLTLYKLAIDPQTPLSIHTLARVYNLPHPLTRLQQDSLGRIRGNLVGHSSSFDILKVRDLLIAIPTSDGLCNMCERCYRFYENIERLETISPLIGKPISPSEQIVVRSFARLQSDRLYQLDRGFSPGILTLTSNSVQPTPTKYLLDKKFL